MKKYVIVVAGGAGLRMGSEIPKQFMLLGDKPLLMYTLEAFYQANSQLHIILVLPESQFGYWEELCNKYHYKREYKLVKGGETRFQSVKNGLELVPEESMVAVHDGVRPFPPSKMILKLFSEAEEKGNAIPAIPLNDSVRKIQVEGNIAVDRTLYKLIQTPQCFQTSILKKAYGQAFKQSFTDEASVVEGIGVKINLIEGDTGNIKITRPDDFFYALARIRDHN